MVSPHAPSLPFRSLASLQDQLYAFGPDRVLLLKQSVFHNLPSDLSSCKRRFLEEGCARITDVSLPWWVRARLFVSGYFFADDLRRHLQAAVQTARSAWLLSRCEPSYLVVLDPKGYHHYFQILEMESLLAAAGDEPPPQGPGYAPLFLAWHSALQRQVIFMFLKKKNSLFFFWVVIALFFIFFLVISSKEPSFTLLQQLKVWMRIL